MSRYASFGEGLERGIRLVDNFIDRRDNRMRQRRLDDQAAQRYKVKDQRAAEAHDVQMQKHNMQINDMNLDQAADMYSSLKFDSATGQPIDMTKLSREDLQERTGQFKNIINRTPEFKRLLTDNPDLDPDNPLAEVDFMLDQKTGEPVAMFSLRMKDGSVKPLTQNRSSDPNDGVVVMPLEEVDRQMMGILGGRGRLATMSQAHQSATAAAAKTRADRSHDFAMSDRKHRQSLELEGVKSKNKADNRIKHGKAQDFVTTDEYGNEVKVTKTWNQKTQSWDAPPKEMDEFEKAALEWMKGQEKPAEKTSDKKAAKPDKQSKKSEKTPEKVALSGRDAKRAGNRPKPSKPAHSKVAKIREKKEPIKTAYRTRGERKQRKDDDYMRFARH